LTEKHDGLREELVGATMKVPTGNITSTHNYDVWHQNIAPTPSQLPKTKDLRARITFNCRITGLETPPPLVFMETCKFAMMLIEVWTILGAYHDG
jgi:hypothetical protein